MKARVDENYERLKEVIPFRFLDRNASAAFLSRCRVVSFAAGRDIMVQGDTRDTDCYILLEGEVEVRDGQGASARRIALIEPNHYFGEWEAIFEVPRVYSIRAREASLCLRFAARVLLDLLATHAVFAQALSAILRDRQGIFKAFELFDAEIVRGISYGHIGIQRLLPIYQTLAPALHGRVADENVLDLAALDYAIRRLPANVTRTFAFLIRDEIPTVYENPDTLFEAIPSDARRRAVWEILPGKDLFLTRSGVSDIYDFVTCLCLYATEARKIRKRIYEAGTIRHISEELKREPVAPAAQAPRKDSTVSPAESQNTGRSVLLGLGFTEAELDGLSRVWPANLLSRIWEIVNHREMFEIDIRTRESSYNLQDFSRWSTQIGKATRTLLGCDPSELDPATRVHIISSNTHSVSNCLNPWFLENAKRVRDWARKTRHPFLDEEWRSPADFIYAVSRDYFRTHPADEKEMKEGEKAHGILRLDATAGTGIEVQVIDLSKIRADKVDALLEPKGSSGPSLIVNIDYAFGEQAEHIIHQLLLLFGKTVRSVNFLGKAGALCGKRGDVLIPTAFIEQASDLFMPVGLPDSGDIAGLHVLLGERDIHLGPMLTVKGTLLQNRLMLNFYRNLWAVNGIEMEGVYYHRQVLESIQTGILASDTVSRFYYYLSDLPLEKEANLSQHLGAHEGIPPLYAITRAILRGIL